MATNLNLKTFSGVSSETLNICAKEPIHLIGSIQNFGIMLVIDRATHKIISASDNINVLLSVSAQQAIGLTLDEVLDADTVHHIFQLKNGNELTNPIISSIILQIDNIKQNHDIQLIVMEDCLILEVELKPSNQEDIFHNLFVPIRDALWKLDSEQNMEHYSQSVVEQVRLLNNFDRVMMYRFDTNWDGEVIAESRVENSTSYLGNHFPASDVPVQVRALYVRNLVRLIADINSTPVALVQNQDNVQPVDLSLSWLRSLSSVHVEYLRNMGVSASLSISLVQDGQLWGLIACHNFSPKYVSIRERELNELIGRTVSIKLMNMEYYRRTELGNRVRQLLYEFSDLFSRSDNLDSVIHIMKNDLLGLVRANGAVLVVNGIQNIIGNIPPQAVIDSIVDTMQQRQISGIFTSQSLGELLPHTIEECDNIHYHHAGMMFAPLDNQLNSYILWFRPSQLRTMRWAGKPEKQIVEETDGKIKISPRQSFETWIQTHRSESMIWSKIEIDAANSLSLSLIEALSERALKYSEKQYRLLAENSADMIATLDLDGCFEFVSPACTQLLGLEIDSIIDKYLGEIFYQEDESIKQLFIDLKEVGSVVTSVLQSKQGQGKLSWIEATFKHTLGSDGCSEIIMNATDITERHNYQLAIEDIHRRNSQILESAAEGVITLNLEGRVIYVNDEALQLLGRDNSNTLMEGHCYDVLCATKEDDCSVYELEKCPFLITLQDGETRQGFHQLKQYSSSKMIDVEYVCSPIIEGGMIEACVIIFHEK